MAGLIHIIRLLLRWIRLLLILVGTYEYIYINFYLYTVSTYMHCFRLRTGQYYGEQTEDYVYHAMHACTRQDRVCESAYVQYDDSPTRRASSSTDQRMPV